MLESLYLIRNNIYFTWFALLIFFFGFCFSYIVDIFGIKSLMWFPRLFVRILSRYVNPKVPFLQNFLVIFFFNSISIFIYMTSGLFIIFPFAIIFLTGMNIGLSVFIPPDAEMEKHSVRQPRAPGHLFRIMLYSTAVLVFEVMVFSVALGMGISLAVATNSITSQDLTSALFLAELLTMRIKAYMLICVPVIALSAWLESSVLKG